MTWTPETNRIPWGLLTEDEQAALQACEYGWERRTQEGWKNSDTPHWCNYTIYRAKPAPKRLVMWLHYDDEFGFDFTYRKQMADNMLKRHGGNLYRIERNEDGSNPTIEVEDV